MSQTLEELLSLLREQLTPEEIVEALGISSESLVNELDTYIELNYDRVVAGLVSCGYLDKEELDQRSLCSEENVR